MQLGLSKLYDAQKEGSKVKNSPLLATCHLPLAFCLLLFAACRFAPPQAPRWDTQLNIPLISHTYSMRELIDKQDNLYADSLGLVHFLAESELDSFRVGDRLSLEAFTQSFLTTIGRYTVPSPGSISMEIALRQIYPAAANLNGQTVPLPAFTFSLPLLAMPDYKNYILVESANGTLKLNLRNDLPVPLGSPLHFEIRDGANNTTIVAFDYNGEIPPGGEMTRVLELAEKSFGNNLALFLSGRSPGSRGNRVPISANSKFTLSLTLSALQVSRASARMDPIVLSDSREIDLGDSLSIVSANLKSGAITVSAQGNFPVTTWLVVTILDIYSPTNTVVTDSFQIPANGHTSKTFNLAGYTFRPLPAAFGQQKIRLRWRIRTTNRPNELISLDSGDHMQATFKSSKIIFAQFKGSFMAKTIDIDPQSFTLDLPNGLDSLRLADVNLAVTLRNGINFQVRADFHIEGITESGKTVSLFVRDRLIKPGKENGTPVESQIILTRRNSNIQQFFNALPRSINVHGKVTFGERDYVGTIRDTDFVSGTLRFDAPLALVLPAQHLESEVDSLTIQESTRQQLKDNLHEGKVIAHLTNHLPFGAAISLHLAQQQAAVFKAPDWVIGPFTLAAPAIDPTTGLTVQAKTSNVEVGLPEKKLELLQKSPLYLGVLIALPGTKGALVRVAATDYIDVKAIAEITFTVDDNATK